MAHPAADNKMVKSIGASSALFAPTQICPKRRHLTDPPLAAVIPSPATGSRPWRRVTGNRRTRSVWRRRQQVPEHNFLHYDF
jgi:hypothetical protein